MMKIDWKKITTKQLAAIVCDYLEQHDIDVTLVGGACVTIYSKNRYLSKDLDFITYESLSKIRVLLKEIGFVAQNRRQFLHKDCPFYLEFLSPPIAIGDQPIHEFNHLKTLSGVIKLLTPTDCVKDRLAAFFYWKDYQALNQAIIISQKNKVNQKQIKSWAIKENQLEHYTIYLQKLKDLKKASDKH